MRGVLTTTTTTLPLADAWGMHDVGTGWWIVMMLAMVLFWAALITGLVWVSRGGSQGSARRDEGTPTDVLNRRLAEGSITPQEYEERRELMAGGAGTRSASAPDDSVGRAPAEGPGPGKRA